MQNQEESEALLILQELRNKELQLIRLIIICFYQQLSASLEDAYHHLKEYVQVWDVAGERQVEITGKDSAKLLQLMTCRDLSKSKNRKMLLLPNY